MAVSFGSFAPNDLKRSLNFGMRKRKMPPVSSEKKTRTNFGYAVAARSFRRNPSRRWRYSDEARHVLGERAARLAGVDDAQEQRVERARMLAHRLGERLAALHVRAHRQQRLAQQRIVDAVRDGVQRIGQRDARLEHGRELPREDHQVGLLDLVGEDGLEKPRRSGWALRVGGAGGALLGDGGDHEVLRAQAADDLLARGGRAHAGDGFPGLIHGCKRESWA